MCIYSIITIVEERAKDDFIKKKLRFSLPTILCNPVRILDALISVFDFDSEIA